MGGMNENLNNNGIGNGESQETALSFDSRSQIADSREDQGFGTSGVRRNGKVARLSRATREKLNQLIDDGVEYDKIIEMLGPEGSGLNKQNISNWAQGGYRNWVKEQERRVLLHGNFERVVDALAKAEPEEVPDLIVKLLAARMGGVLSELTPQDLRENSEKHPQTLARLLALVPKLSREALRTRKYRDAVESHKATSPESAEAREKARTKFLDSMDQLFGIRPRKRPAANEQNAINQTTESTQSVSE